MPWFQARVEGTIVSSWVAAESWNTTSEQKVLGSSPLLCAFLSHLVPDDLTAQCGDSEEVVEVIGVVGLRGFQSDVSGLWTFSVESISRSVGSARGLDSDITFDVCMTKPSFCLENAYIQRNVTAKHGNSYSKYLTATHVKRSLLELVV